MRQMRIALDWDGITVNTGKLKVQKAKDLYGIDVPLELCGGEEITKIITVRQYHDLRQAVSGWSYGLTAEPIPEALAYIPKLQAEGHYVAVVTARKGDLLEVARAWSTMHGLSLTFYGVGWEISKTPALEGFDVVLEDTVENLIDASRVVHHRFLLTMPYNARIPTPQGIIRVPCWCNFYKKVHQLATGQ